MSASDARTRQAIEQLNNESALRGALVPAKDLLALEEKVNLQSGEKNQRHGGGDAIKVGSRI